MYLYSNRLYKPCFAFLCQIHLTTTISFQWLSAMVIHLAAALLKPVYAATIYY